MGVEARRFKVTVHDRRPTSNRGTVFLVTLLLVTLAALPGQGAPPAPIPSLHEVITNCPPIVELVMRYRAGGQPDELYQVRLQSNAFFVRATREAALVGEFDSGDTLCGFWGDEYWLSEPGSPGPSGRRTRRALRTYRHDPADPVSVAYNRVRHYLGRVGHYTSMGIGNVVPPDSVHQNAAGHFVYHTPDRRFSTTAVLDPAEPLPADATLHVVAKDHGVQYTDYVSYRYRPDIADGRLPSSVEFTEHHSIEVLAITFGAGQSPLPKEAFMPPPQLLAIDGISHIVESNRTLYRVLPDGRLAALDARSAERQLRSGPGAARGPIQWVFISVIVGLSLMLALWLKRKQPSKTTPLL
jgi:hypothetical protein